MKKKLLITIAGLALAAGGGGIAFTMLNNNSESESSQQNEKEIVDNTLKIHEVIEINIFEEVPTIEDFIANGSLAKEATLTMENLPTKTIYYNAEGEEVSSKEALKNKVLKDGYTSKDLVLKLGEYPATIIDPTDNQEFTITIKVIDNIAPELILQEVKINEGKTYKLKDFVTSCTDNSTEKCTLSFSNDNMQKITKVGTHDIEITAKDSNGNEIKLTTTLTIVGKNEPEKDNEKPENNTNNNANEQTSNNNSSNNNNNSDNNDNNSNSYEVKTLEETSTETKYGVTITTTKLNTYHIYPDGTKKLQSSTTKNVSYNKDNFNANTTEMISEANALTNEHNAKIQEILKKVNEYRAEVGVDPLVLDKDVTLAASIRAIENGYGIYSHDRPNGSECFTVLDELNITYWAAGENIAYGYTTPAAVSEGWYNSQGHYENMVNKNFTKIGIGVIKTDKWYWVQMFTK